MVRAYPAEALSECKGFFFEIWSSLYAVARTVHLHVRGKVGVGVRRGGEGERRDEIEEGMDMHGGKNGG